jgi:hypothetical protein
VDAPGQAVPCAAPLAHRVLSPGPRVMPGPHDLFARYAFGQPERAAAELRAVLPPQVVSQVDWSTVTFCGSETGPPDRSRGRCYIR